MSEPRHDVYGRPHEFPKNVHLAPGLRAAVRKSVFSARVHCPKCKESIPRKLAPAHGCFLKLDVFLVWYTSDGDEER